MTNAYPAYKESGVEWVGKLPSHWTIMPLKYAAIVNREALTEQVEEDFELQYIDIGNVNQLGIINPPERMQFVDAPSRARRIIRKNDTIISTVRTYLKAVAFIQSEDENLIASTGFATLTSLSDTFPKYLYYLVSSQGFVDTVSARSVGVSYPAITSTELARITAWLPPLSEQQGIADFLDCKTAQIDTLIEKKQRQIELLQEQCTALINRAVTKGLNPDVPMKDSGVEWLGEIPNHWDVNIKLTMLAEDTRNSFVNGPFGSNLLVSELTESGVPVIYIKDVRNGIYKRKSTEHVTAEKALELDSCRVDPGDILIAKVGDPPGATAVYPDSEPSGIVTQDVIRIKLKTSIVLPQYFTLFFNSEAGRAVVGQVTIASTRSRIPLGDFKNVRIPLPPINEQIQIIEELSELLSQADKVEKISYNLIERLQEYRTALISEAVTGKIDVRMETVHE